MHRRLFLALTGTSTGISGRLGNDDELWGPQNQEGYTHPTDGPEVTVRDIRTLEYDRPVWLDSDGTLYGRAGSQITRSDNWWKTTERLYDFEDAGTVHGILTTDEGRIIAGVGRSIYVSDPTQAEFERVYEFDRGRFPFTFGHAIHDETIVIGSYQADGYEDGAYAGDVILSRDGGETWDHVYELPFRDRDANIHIHDVEVDPFGDRLWIVAGHGKNGQVAYSEDWGETWVDVWDGGGAPALTQVVAFEDHVSFGTDTIPEGIWRWDRDTGGPHEPEDIAIPYVQIEDEIEPNELRYVARRRWHDRDTGLCLMPFGANRDWAHSCVLATDGGDEWHEIYRHPEPGRDAFHLTNCIGPLPDDDDRRILITESCCEGVVIDASLPELEA